MLVDGSALEVVAAHGHRTNIVGVRMNADQGVAWSVMKKGMGARFSGLVAGARFDYRTTLCSIVVPIVTHGAGIGTFNLSRSGSEFQDGEAEVVEMIASTFSKLLHLREYLNGAASLGCAAVPALLGFIKFAAPDLEEVALELDKEAERQARAQGERGLGPFSRHTAVLSLLAAAYLPYPERQRVISREDLTRCLQLLSAETLRLFEVGPEISSAIERAIKLSMSAAPRAAL